MSALAEETDTDGIAGKCVLVVEDDYVLAREVCSDLTRHGAQILGPAPTVHYASLIMGKRHLDGAILDIKLFGEEVYELVDVLIARGVPIIFATAYQPERIDARYRMLDVLPKPLDFAHLRRKVAAFSPLPPRPVSPPVPLRSTSMAHGPSAEPERARSDLPQDQWARLMLTAMSAGH